MRKEILISLLGLVILITVGCSHDVPPPTSDEYVFEDGFNDMLALDSKYNASFYREALDVENMFSDGGLWPYDWNRTLVALTDIDLMIQDLELLKQGVLQKGSSDEDIIIEMIDTRIVMLRSEEAYQLGLELRNQADPSRGFSCKTKYHVIAIADAFNESRRLGNDVTRRWDKLLTYNQDKVPQLLGNENRPKFYDSPFWPIERYAVANLNIINKLCS